jgi:hypothetical protein
MQNADCGRLIAVAFPLTSARRSSAYAGQMIAGLLRWLSFAAADPPAAVVGGACQEIWPAAGLSTDAAWSTGVLVLRPAGRRREPAVTNAAVGPARQGRRP